VIEVTCDNRKLSNSERASAQASFTLSSSGSCGIANRARATRAFVAGPLYNETAIAIVAATVGYRVRVLQHMNQVF
jgi:hypothetical protein